MFSEELELELWLALGLPAPEDLLRQLQAGCTVRVLGHTLVHDVAAGVVWATNPYGVDGVLCSGAPDLEQCRVFLDALARGEMCGPEP